MRLKKIEVLGFKSFADRQLVIVDEHVTGVIGPNGCGKSNIVDAIRWCMGEQSAKHLRGTGMSDVIFAGCTSRGPAGMAEVTLTFYNPEGHASQHFDHPEIALTRRLYGDGTSEYLINKVPARLRDFTELLTGTGAGTKGYSIIEQGQVGRIVSSKPEDRRHVIDEAAGITRFKAQKAAAERKIEATQQNLNRVRDVVSELESRLSTLSRQAQKAERYKRYREELRDLELWAASHKFLELASMGSVMEARYETVRVQVEDLREALASRETAGEVKRTKLTEVERELSLRQQTVYDLDNRIRLIGAESDYRRRERDGLAQSSTQTEAEADAAERGLVQLDEELADVVRQAEALGTGEEPGAVVRELETSSREAEQAVAQARQRQDRARIQCSEQASIIDRAEARTQSREESIRTAQGRVQDLESELQTWTDRQSASQAEMAQAALRVSEATEGCATLRTDRQELDRMRKTLREQVSAAEVALDTKRAEIHRHRSRLQSLEEIQSRYRGCNSGVQVVMEHRQELAVALSSDGSTDVPPATGPVYGILADYVHAPEKFETAVSAWLGDRLEGVVVDAPAVGARGVAILKREQEGRTAFVPRRGREIDRREGVVAWTEGTVLGWADPHAKDGGATVAPFEVLDLSEGGHATLVRDPEEESGLETLLDQPGVLGRLQDLVQVSGDMASIRESLLGDAVIVESLPRALELWEEHPTEATLLTLEGDRIEPTGIVVGGSPTSLNSALLQQKREIRDLEQILEALQEDFQAASGRHQILAEELHDVEQRRERSESEVIEAEKRLVQARGDHDRLGGDVRRLEREIEGKRRTLAGIHSELGRHTQEVERDQQALVQARAKLAEHAAIVAAGEAEWPTLVEARDKVTQALTEAKVAWARWQQQTDSLSASRGRLSRQVQSERHRIARLRESAESAKRRMAELEATNETAASERNTAIEQHRAATQAVHESRELFEGLRVELDDLELSMRGLRGEVDQRRQQLSNAELGLREINLEREHLLNDTRDRFDLEVADVLIDFHDRPMATQVEVARQRELKGILARMGEVNLTAIAEFEEVSGRHTYLTEQKQDLERAVAQLQEAIDHINKTTRDRFKQTFDQVDAKFQQLFPRLFGGGQARLKMTDPDDLLGTGVEIEARPPGKQPRTLDLLSGGEKALTAVSLIFAIFLIRPSPFCILDEVDAPLDDANVSRFCALVRDLAGHTQFIIITHNKVTMETADRLYGVTMEQRGVSKLVSVNLRRAVELAYN